MLRHFLVQNGRRWSVTVQTKRDKLNTPAIGDKPHQPSKFKFPKCPFGLKTVVFRALRENWFSRWSWLHYVEEDDTAYCFNCVKAYQLNQLHSKSSLESVYISDGFTNWKEASVRFPKHEESNCHKEAMLQTGTLPATTRDIGESLSSQFAAERFHRRQCFLKLLSNVRFLSRQALPLRGHGDEMDSNFTQLLKLRGEDDLRIFEWIKKKTEESMPFMRALLVVILSLLSTLPPRWRGTCLTLTNILQVKCKMK